MAEWTETQTKRGELNYVAKRTVTLLSWYTAHTSEQEQYEDSVECDRRMSSIKCDDTAEHYQSKYRAVCKRIMEARLRKVGLIEQCHNALKIDAMQVKVMLCYGAIAHDAPSDNARRYILQELKDYRKHLQIYIDA